jgi:hypothetical protein
MRLSLRPASMLQLQYRLGKWGPKRGLGTRGAGCSDDIVAVREVGKKQGGVKEDGQTDELRFSRDAAQTGALANCSERCR